ncbi:hypothetical protein A9502_31525 [Klebsiella pneumoniae]|nr:hypothetical protein A9502_31525 [Klebsiella pneumoniae]
MDDAINRRISLLVLNQQAEQAILHENAESQNESLDDLKTAWGRPFGCRSNIATSQSEVIA